MNVEEFLEIAARKPFDIPIVSTFWKQLGIDTDDPEVAANILRSKAKQLGLKLVIKAEEHTVLISKSD